MKPHTVVSALVTEVLPRGIHLDVDGFPGFVNVTELTWNQRGGQKPAQFATVGDTIEVYVCKVTDDRFAGSLKQVHPEDDPWADPTQVAPGTLHRGIAYKIVDFGAFVELECGIVGLLRPDGVAVAADEVITVVIETMEPSWKVELRRADPGQELPSPR